MPNVSLETSMNVKWLKFGPIDRHDLSNQNRHYYTQDLIYNDRELIFTTDWFRSGGIHFGLDKKPEMLVPTSPFFFRVYKAVEDEAVRCLKLPPEFQLQQSNEEAFRRLPTLSKVYAKFDHDIAFFDKQSRPIKQEDLGHGEYRVILHVKGLYIGPHGRSLNKFASLQLRIKQVQFVQVPVTCLFSAPVAMPHLVTAMNPPETPQPGVTKKLRRTKAQRQNTTPVVEDKIQENHVRPMEQYPTDFFTDLDFEEAN